MTDHRPIKSRTILLVSIILSSLCLLCGIGVAGYYWFWVYPKVSLAKNLRDWIPENSTPGTRLLINETGRQMNQGRTKIYYEAMADGLPPHTDFILRAYDQLLLKETGVWSLQSDTSGKLVLKQFSASNFVRGELLVFVLVSDDSDIRAYARVFPFPIEAIGDDSCRVWVELIDTRGTSFAAYGEGFEPNETLDYLSVNRAVQTNMQMRNTIQVDDNGMFTSFMYPQILGKQSGTLTETFTGQKCKVTIEYEWGLAALEVQ